MSHDRRVPAATEPGAFTGPVELRVLTVEGATRLLTAARGSDGAADYPGVEDMMAAQRLLWSHDYGDGTGAFGTFEVLSEGLVVGHAGYHGPPHDGTVEISFAVVPSARRRAVATRAVRLLLVHAWANGATEVTAQVAPGNVASMAVLRAAGLRRGAQAGGMTQHLVRRGPPGARRTTAVAPAAPGCEGPSPPAPPGEGG